MSRVAVAAKVIVAVTVVVLLPGLVFSALGFGGFSGVSALAAIAAAIPTMRVSPRLGATVVAAVTLASALTVPAATDAVWAGLLMAAVAGLTGVAGRFGAASAVIMAPISIVFLLVEPPTTVDGRPAGMWLVGAVVLASSAWAVGVAALLARGHERTRGQRQSWVRTGLYAGVLAVVVGVATAVVVDRGLGHGGGWFVMTLFIVIQPYVQDALRKTAERGLGTVLGFVIAITVIALLPTELLRYVAGSVFAVLAMRALFVQHRPYWQYVTLLTPSVVLLEGAGSNAMGTAWQRLLFTLLGVAVAVSIELALYPVFRHAAERAGVNHF